MSNGEDGRSPPASATRGKRVAAGAGLGMIFGAPFGAAGLGMVLGAALGLAGAFVIADD